LSRVRNSFQRPSLCFHCQAILLAGRLLFPHTELLFFNVLAMYAAVAADAAGKGAPSGHVMATYALFLFLAFMVYHHVAGGEFSSILTMSVIFQCLSVSLLALQVLTKKSAAGISAKSLQLDVFSLCFRLSSTIWLNGYLPVDMTGDWLYQAIDVCTLVIVLWLLFQVLVVRKSTYSETSDSLAISPLVCILLVLAFLLHADMNSRPLFDALWMAGLFVGSVAELPQLWLIARSGGRAETLMSHHIAAMMVSRLLSGSFMWHARRDVTCEFWVDGFNHAMYAILAAHALHLILLGDFAYYYAKAVAKGGLANCTLELEGDMCV